MTAAVLAFVLAGAALVVLPGPDSMLMLRAIAVGGRPAAVRTAAGILTGLALWITSAAIGLAALLEASETGYAVLRYVGAAYLLLLGVQALRSRGTAGPEGTAPRAGLLGVGYAAGLATNVFNPKVGVFFVTFLPGFVPEGAPVGPMSLLFGAIFVLETLVYFAVLVLLVDRIAAALRNSTIRRRIERVSGAVLVGFGVRLATEG